jgi:hypothetical protein
MKQETEKERIIQAFDEAYEKLIISANAAEKSGKFLKCQWGPREILAHIAGWAAQATVQIPQVIAGIPDVTYHNDVQHAAVDDAANAAFIALIGDQSFEEVRHIANQTHQRFAAMLGTQSDSIFVPGNYVYERMKRVIDHHLQHAQELDG